MPTLRIVLRILRPLYLLFATLTYAIGAGIAHYLGYHFNMAALVLGLIIVLALLCAMSLLNEYFRLAITPLAADETFRGRIRSRAFVLQMSGGALFLAVMVTITAFYTHLLSLTVGILLGMAFLLLVAYAAPPLRWADAGYGELVLAVYFATFTPAFAFLLQSDVYHRLLGMTTFPLTLLALAYLLVLDFPTFATDLKRARHTLLTRLTWQRAIPIHHILVLSGFLLFAAAPFLGFPWGVVWPAFLVLPFALLQIIWLQRIAMGGRTLWNFLITVATAVFGLLAYLLALNFWIR